MRRPWLSTFLLGILCYVIASRVLVFLGPFGGWVAILLFAFLYIRWDADRIRSITSPVGFGIGMGAILGAATIETAVLINLLIDVFITAVAPPSTGLATFGVFGAIRSFLHLLYAHFVGAVLGLLGGLIGASTIPR